MHVEQPNALVPAPAAQPVVAADDHDEAEAAPNDGKDHRALYVDRVAADMRNFVVDAAGALETKPSPCSPTTKLPATKTTWSCALVDGKGLLASGADGSLHYSAANDGAYVVVRDPRPAE